ncbi:MAG: hypothetical protein AAFY52_10230 [Pseudomonadota bacterium]
MKSICASLLIAVTAVFTVPAQASAQQLIAAYYAMLTGPDLSNSRGVPLGSFCAIVQQDRANYHRFGIRQQGDEWDPVFADRNARSVISTSCQMAAGSEYVPASLAQYGSKFVYVQVFGSGGVPTLILVSEGAG